MRWWINDCIATWCVPSVTCPGIPSTPEARTASCSITTQGWPRCENLRQGERIGLEDKFDSLLQPIWGNIDDMPRPELYIGRSVAIMERYCVLGGVTDQEIRPYKASSILGEITDDKN